MKKLALAFIAVLTVLVSCKKDEKKNPEPSSRTLRYEITGNFTGSLVASYTTASGGTSNDQVTLPWNKEINYAQSVTAAILAVSGSGGTAGQKVTVVIKRGGVQVGETIEATAGSAGSFTKAAAPIVF
ncbi:hypothetical protein ABIE26_001644 [Pedobacter africanus]|uniref:Uncharacterized protein n=1 Tax=Pedobacter africanus TaxID=151894 RepID=A0ACC6KRW3_9SPHI|nr:hypothetical protein [Pedobacter africanus]MDR6781867.1 hypothetical protein [Pedobacter africanus]